MELTLPSLGLAFLAGLASFLSPCVFALVPAYVSYLGGRTAAASGERKNGSDALGHGFAFVLGFSLVFILLGLISSAVGAVLYQVQEALMVIGGAITILLGLQLAGILRIPFLEFDVRLQRPALQKSGYLSSALLGVFFSAGWSPCIGPVLGVILTLAANGGSPLEGGFLLTAYSAGLAIPFLLAATQIGWVTYLLRRRPKLGLTIQRIMGILLALVGVLLLTGRLSALSNLGAFFGFYNESFVGMFLLVAAIFSAIVGFIAAWWTRKKDPDLTERWFLVSGLSFFLIVTLFLLGAFPFLA